jgi:hypothetical protein
MPQSQSSTSRQPTKPRIHRNRLTRIIDPNSTTKVFYAARGTPFHGG